MNMIARLCTLAALVLASGITSAAKLPGPLVDAAWLERNLSSVTIIDVRADTKSFTTAPMYMRDMKTGQQQLARIGGHIPGALLTDYRHVRDTRLINGRKVTRMLPKRKDFEALMQQVGLNRESTVVIVSKGEGNGDVTMATRLYWQLKYYGQDRLAILDGGMASWLMDGGEASTDGARPPRGNWKATAEREALLATSDEVATAVKTGNAQLVDTRSLAQYLGTYKKSYVYAKGHIPGAKPFPNELLTQPTAPATFTPTKTLRTLAATLKIDTDKDIITYCNSGHLASGSWFVFSELMGNKNVRLYDGSMLQWTL
ncbi:MAG: sulfurtransferase, partial [Gammaproteobacteria bacterium]|nr:sulfurtransferase [Gammaproteobacteria bacterium]